MKWITSIAGFDSVGPYLTVTPPSLIFSGTTILQRLERFLQGSGLPCPELFKAVQGGFSSIIDISQISAESFRARVLVWAVTGSPSWTQGLTISM